MELPPGGSGFSTTVLRSSRTASRSAQELGAAPTLDADADGNESHRLERGHVVVVVVEEDDDNRGDPPKVRCTDVVVVEEEEVPIPRHGKEEDKSRTADTGIPRDGVSKA